MRIIIKIKKKKSELLQQKAIKNSSSVIYPPKRLVITHRLWGEGSGVLEDLGRVTTIFTQSLIRFYKIPMTPSSLGDS